MPLHTLIVDDEVNAGSNLEMMLEEYCPELVVKGIANSADEARKLLANNTIDVVFLDIKMPQEDGFTFLKALPDREFSVVFTTAHNEFALKAFQEDAVDYLEKPINVEDLQNAAKKLSQLHNRGSNNQIGATAIDTLLNATTFSVENEKISIPTRDGYVLIRNKDIVRLEASDSYTNIFLEDGRRFMSSKNIKVYEDKLNPKVFYRTHKSHIINTLFHLEAFSRTDGNFAILSDESSVPVSRRKLPEFLERIASF